MRVLDCEFVDESEDSEVAALDRSDLEKIASSFILKYFEDKSIPTGTDLCSDYYIDTVLGSTICEGVDRAYVAMEASGKFDTSASDHLISEDIRYVIKTLSQIRKRVPAEFAAGMLLMHLELVEGIPL